MNYKKILSGVPDELKNLEDKGKVASYIPEFCRQWSEFPVPSESYSHGII